MIGWINNDMVGWLGDEAMNDWLDQLKAARLDNEMVGWLNVGTDNRLRNICTVVV